MWRAQSLFVLGIGLLCVALPSAADHKPPTVKDELKRLKGTWVMFAAEREGSGVPRVEVQRIVFDGNKYTFYPDDNKLQEVTFTLNPAAKPPAIDIQQNKKTQ